MRPKPFKFPQGGGFPLPMNIRSFLPVLSNFNFLCCWFFVALFLFRRRCFSFSFSRIFVRFWRRWTLSEFCHGIGSHHECWIRILLVAAWFFGCAVFQERQIMRRLNRLFCFASSSRSPSSRLHNLSWVQVRNGKHRNVWVGFHFHACFVVSITHILAPHAPTITTAFDIGCIAFAILKREDQWDMDGKANEHKPHSRTTHLLHTSRFAALAPELVRKLFSLDDIILLSLFEFSIKCRRVTTENESHGFLPKLFVLFHVIAL